MIRNLSASCWYALGFQNRFSDAQVFANDIAVVSTNILAILLNVCANGFVIYTYLKSRSTQPISNTLLFLLATFDLLHGITSHTLFVATKVLELYGIFNCNVLVLSNVVGVAVGGFSFVLVTFVVTSERLFAIIYPIYHRVYIQRRLLVAFSLLLFVFWVTLISFVFYTTKIVSLGLYLSVIALGLVYGLAVYVKIYCVIRKSSDFVRSSKTTGLKRKHTKDECHELEVSGKIQETQERSGIASERRRIERNENYTSNGGQDEMPKEAVKTNPETKFRQRNPENKLDLKLLDISKHQNDALAFTAGGVSNEQQCTNSNAITNLRTSGTTTQVSMKEWNYFQKTSPSSEAKMHSNNQMQGMQSGLKTSTVNRREKRTIVRMLYILGALYICNIPLLCYFFLSLEGYNDVLSGYLFPWSRTFYFAGTILNTFIYCYKNEHFWHRRFKSSAALMHASTNLSFSDHSKHATSIN